MYVKVSSEAEFYELCNNLEQTKGPLFFDLETTGLDPYTTDILLMSLKCDGMTYVIDFTNLDIKILQQCRALRNDRLVKVAHNLIFDYKHIYHHTGVALRNLHCTLIIDQVINSGIYFEFDLESVALRRLNVQLDKKIRNAFINRDVRLNPITEEEIAYAAQDSDILEAIYNQQIREICDRKLDRVYNVECPLIPVTASMEYEGLCIEKERLESALPVTQDILARVNKSIQDELIEAAAISEIVFSRDGYVAINTASPAQMLAAVNTMGIDVKSLGSKELSDWDAIWTKKNLKNLEAKTVELQDDTDDMNIGFNHPLLRKHAIRTAVEKIQGTYIEGLLRAINPVTHRIHPGFKQCGAVRTGRYSSVQPNFQNLTNKRKLVDMGLGDHDIRSMFIAAPGCDFVICDFSGIELVILALLAQEPRLIDQILKGDIHAYVANSLEGDRIKAAIGDYITPENKKSNHRAKDIRDAFKTVSYGIAYGSTGYNMYRTLYLPLAHCGIIISQKDADRWVEDWKNELFPNTGRLLNQNGEYAVTRGYTESVLGRKRFWSSDVRYGDKWKMLAAMREGMNQPIQSSSADMTKLALVMLDQRLDHRYGRIAGTVHDEIIVESQHHYTDQAMVLTRHCMESAGYLLFPYADPGLIVAEPKKSNCYDK